MNSKNISELNLINLKENINNIKLHYNLFNSPKNKKHSHKSKHFKSSPEKDNILRKLNNTYNINAKQEKKIFFSLIKELEELELSFIKQFEQDTKYKIEDEIKMIIPQKKIEYENRLKLILTKAEKELMIYKDKYKMVKKRNIELKQSLNMINKQKDRLNKDLKESELSIEKINKKYELFNQLKPYYESLAFEFNIKDNDNKSNKDNKKKHNYDIEKNIENRKNYVFELGKEIQQKSEDINKLKKEARIEEMNMKKSNKKLFNYFIELEKNDKNIEEECKSKISNLKQEIDYNKFLQKEKDKILYILITVFNLLYEKLNLQRDLIIKPKNIDLIKNDYTPQVYITEEIINYINLMLHNSTDESCGLLLREIASYANMMLREENEEFNKMKYDPVKTVNEIENYINKIKQENKSLNNEVKNILKENKKEKEQIQQLNGQINQINKMYEKLHETIKKIYANENSQKKQIKKCLSASNINSLKDSHEYDNDSEEKENNKRFIYLRKYLEGKKDKKIKFVGGANNFIEHINKIFFYKNQCDIKQKDFGVYVNAHKRMIKKFYKLKKLKEKKNKYTTVENAVTGNINENIDKLIFKIHQDIKKYK